METKQNLPGVFDLIRDTFNFYKGNYKKLIPVGLVLLVLGLVTDIIAQIDTMADNSASAMSAGLDIILFCVVIIIGFLSAILSIVSQAAYLREIVEIDAGRPMTVKEVYTYGLRLFFPILWMAVLTTLIVMGTSILFVIPGLVMSVFIAFSAAIFVVEDKRGLSAISTSFYYVKNNFWKVLGRLLVFIIIILIIAIIISAVVLFIAAALYIKALLEEPTLATSIYVIILGVIHNFLTMCVYMPILYIFNYKLYKSLKALKPEPNPESDLKHTRSWMIGWAILGLISVPVIFSLIFWILQVFGFD